MSAPDRVDIGVLTLVHQNSDFVGDLLRSIEPVKPADQPADVVVWSNLDDENI